MIPSIPTNMKLLSFRPTKPLLMKPENNSPEQNKNNILNTAVDLTLKIGILLWALVIAIILAPTYDRIGMWFGKRKKLAAVVITITGLAILLDPPVINFSRPGLKQIS